MSDSLQEARRLGERKTLAKLREGTEVLRTGGGIHLTAAECNVLLDLAQRVEAADEERANLAQLYDLANERADKAERENERLTTALTKIRTAGLVKTGVSDQPESALANPLGEALAEIARQALRQEEERPRNLNSLMPDSNQESPARAEALEIVKRIAAFPANDETDGGKIARAYLDSEAKLVALREALRGIGETVVLEHGHGHISFDVVNLLAALVENALAASEEKGA